MPCNWHGSCTFADEVTAIIALHFIAQLQEAMEVLDQGL
jgi:hypothetical protein